MQTRRSFLKFGAGAAAVGAFAPLSVSANSSDIKWDEEHEVVIVGSGFAGLAAAVEAGKLGAKDIVVFEKLGVYGGNSTLNAGQARCFSR